MGFYFVTGEQNAKNFMKLEEKGISALSFKCLDEMCAFFVPYMRPLYKKKARLSNQIKLLNKKWRSTSYIDYGLAK